MEENLQSLTKAMLNLESMLEKNFRPFYPNTMVCTSTVELVIIILSVLISFFSCVCLFLLCCHAESRAKASQDEYRATKVWQPIKDLTAEDDSVIDGYLELACSPASPYAGRNKELALHLLFQLGGSVKVCVCI